MSVLATERLKLWIAYDGRRFSGWQSQTNGKGVQDHLEAAFLKIVGSRVIVHGSGRTDAGVHALGQVAHVDVPLKKHQLLVWRTALNASLPFEVRVLRVTRVRGTIGTKKGFHARYDALGKIYIYRIGIGSFLHPLEIGRAWHVPGSFDMSALQQACKILVGKHDFMGFAANRGEPEKDTVRTIRRVSATKRGSLITLSFEGDGFLYKMVRLLTGALIRVAQNKAPISYIHDILKRKGNQKTQFSAPSDGLYLKRVIY